MIPISRLQIRTLITKPEQYAEEMTLEEIDKVVAGFISVRYDKQRWAR